MTVKFDSEFSLGTLSDDTILFVKVNYNSD